MSWEVKVRLFNNVPFDLKNNHTRWFDNSTQQNNYFNSLNPVETLTNLRYVNIDSGVMDLENYADSIDNVNYAIIENYNSGVSNSNVRRYFVFITKTEYINARNTKLHFEVDVLQTYHFDLQFKQSFVERQHLNSANKASENIDIGDTYLNIFSHQVKGGSDKVDMYFDTVLVTATDVLNASAGSAYGGVVSGIITPLLHYIVLVPKTFNDLPGLKIQLNGETIQEADGVFLPYNIFKAFKDETLANRIVSISYLPAFPYNHTVIRSGDGTTTNHFNIQVNNQGAGKQLSVYETVESGYKNITINKFDAETIQDYVSVNVKQEINTYFSNNGITDPKLKQYPFVRVMLRDNFGGEIEIKPEYLDGNTVRANLLTSISATPKIAYQLKNYKTGTHMTNALISSVNADVEVVNDYTATYIQGKKNVDNTNIVSGLGGSLVQLGSGIGIAIASGGTLGLVAGVATGVGGVVNTFNTLAGHIAKYQDIDNVPPSLQTQRGASSLMIGYNYAHPQVDIEVCDLEYLKRANSFLKQYGHTVKDVTDLNLKTRTHYNFIKTIGCNVVGTVPQNHLDKVRNIFDSGVTLWHVNDIYNYNVANNVR